MFYALNMIENLWKPSPGILYELKNPYPQQKNQSLKKNWFSFVLNHY